MLVLSRKMNESIEIQPVDKLDETPLRELFADGGIQIKLVRISKNRVRVAIEAPAALKISRGPRVDGRNETDALQATAADRLD